MQEDAPVVASCPHQRECPGCPSMPLAKDAQLAEKHASIERALAPYGLQVALAPRIVAPEPTGIGYRTRAKLVTGKGGALGLFRAGTHEVVDLPGCVVLRPIVARVALAVRALLSEQRVSAVEDGGWLAGIDVREAIGARGEVHSLVTLLVNGTPPADEIVDVSDALVERCPDIASLAMLVGQPGPQLLAGKLEILRGPNELQDRLDPEGPYHYAAHGSFVQASRLAASAIAARIESLARTAKSPPRVLELFAGSGTTGLTLARAGASVVSVEIFAPAIGRAERAASEQGLSRRFEARRADADEAIAHAIETGEVFDMLVVNPPRRGLSASLRESIVRLAPKRMAYVSCEPRTLARDLAHLARIGLGPISLEGFDMMPQTGKVESLAVLAPAPIPPPVILHEEGDLVVVRKEPHEPTTPHPEHPTSLTDRVRALPFLGAAQPIHRLDVGTSGLCLFARRPDAVAALSDALRSGTKTYVALVRGIPHKKGRVASPLDERGKLLEATTRFVRREVLAGHALVEASPQEGRTHQIRRHLASIGHAVLGDARYGHAPSNRHLFERYGLDRTFLHLACLVLTVDGKEIVLEAPMAPDLAAVLEAMRGAKREVGRGP
jgi:23S rRNA (uracil1939-C5)-methyltransferase